MPDNDRATSRPHSNDNGTPRKSSHPLHSFSHDVFDYYFFVSDRAREKRKERGVYTSCGNPWNRDGGRPTRDEIMTKTTDKLLSAFVPRNVYNKKKAIIKTTRGKRPPLYPPPTKPNSHPSAIDTPPDSCIPRIPRENQSRVHALSYAPRRRRIVVDRRYWW